MIVKEKERYRHFKGGIYEIICIATDTETQKKQVVYKSLKSDKIWVRPYDMFTSKVDKEKYPDVTDEYRFQKINNA